MKDGLVLNIAGFNILVDFKVGWPFFDNNFKKQILDFFQGFVMEKKPKKIDFTIKVVFKRNIPIILKKKKNQYYINLYTRVNKTLITVIHTISMLELQIVIGEIILKLLADNDGFLLHGSSVRGRRGAIIFNGENGAGKSTAMQLLQPKLPALADDLLMIRKVRGKFFLYQVAIVEKNYWIKRNSRKHVIEKIFIVRKSPNFKQVKITNKDYLINHFSKQIFTEKRYLARQLRSLVEFIEGFKEFYFLYFAKDREKFLRFMS